MFLAEQCLDEAINALVASFKTAAASGPGSVDFLSSWSCLHRSFILSTAIRRPKSSNNGSEDAKYGALDLPDAINDNLLSKYFWDILSGIMPTMPRVLKNGIIKYCDAPKIVGLLD